MEDQPKRRLKVDLEELGMALENRNPEGEFYLDLETGEVIAITSDMRYDLQGFLEDLDAGEDDQAAVLEAIQAADNEIVTITYQVDQNEGERYLLIQPLDQRSGYQAMEAFIETIQNLALQQHLTEAIQNKGAFRRFKDTISRFPAELKRWYDFKDLAEKEEALRWLKVNDIEYIE